MPKNPPNAPPPATATLNGTIQNSNNVPLTGALAGTITSAGTTVTGTGTNFGNLGDACAGDVIVTSDGQFQIVTGVASTTSLTIQQAFATPVTGLAYKVVHA